MQVHSFYIHDLDPRFLTIEYSARFQIPGFQILGLPSPEIQEARERIIAAFQASGLEFPGKRILINLAPASIRKSGTGHDLAIALKILSESGHPVPESGPVLAWGELGLDGSIRPSGRMGHLIELLLRKDSDIRGITVILSPEDHAEFRRLLAWRAREGFSNPDLKCLVRIHHLRNLPGTWKSEADPVDPPFSESPAPNLTPPSSLLPLGPFQERILKIACIGRHHTLLLGPKGVGKSASLFWFRALGSEPNPESAWERALYQESRNEKPHFDAPVRQVHSQVRPAHLLGSFHSGSFRAGELSLAHGGMFFADEFPEWARDSKECLREPLQSESFHLTSVRGTLQAKCDLQLIGSGNLCPCGGIPLRFRAQGIAETTSCRCTEREVRGYLNRLSGPILDRIDLWALFPAQALDPGQAAVDQAAVSVAQIRREVEQARVRARNAFGTLPSRIPADRLEALVPKDPSVIRLLRGSGSFRERHKLIRIACSIAALEGREHPRPPDFQEARTYRALGAHL